MYRVGPHDAVLCSAVFGNGGLPVALVGIIATSPTLARARVARRVGSVGEVGRKRLLANLIQVGCHRT
jgi:hypothetical protein